MTIAHNIPLPVPAVKKAIVRKLAGAAKDIYETLPQCGDKDSFLVDGNLKGIRLTAGKIAAKLNKEYSLTSGETFATFVAEESGKIRVWRVKFVAKTPKAAKAAV